MCDTPGLLLRRVQEELRAERHVDPAHEAPHRHQALHLQGVRPGEAGQHGIMGRRFPDWGLLRYRK